MEHLTEDDLVLHYYGELDGPVERAAAAHLEGCGDCRRSYTRLQRVLAAVESSPAPSLPDGFERTVWARLEPALPSRSRGWLSWFLAPANLAWATAVVVLVSAAFFAGRLSEQRNPAAGGPAVTAEQLREQVLLTDLGEHLDRSQTMLVELVSAEDPAGDETVDLSVERARAEDLVAANRLYRQAAASTGDTSVTQLLDELERLLVELAASPDELSGEDVERVKQRMAARDLLFKVRVVSSAVRERQKQQMQTRAGAGQSS